MFSVMRNIIGAAMVVILALPVVATTDGELSEQQESRKSDFDYLLGDWEFTAVSREWGTLRG
jgi:hypothetical protein